MDRHRGLRFIVLLVAAAIWILPLAAVFLFSLAPNADVLKGVLVPSALSFENYGAVLGTTSLCNIDDMIASDGETGE